MSERYQKSEALLKRALNVIPLGTQTFSKSKTQYPFDVSPYYVSRGQGSHVWDVDENEYIDFINGLAAITLGYNDPDVTVAVKSQLEQGVIFSQAHSIEIEVAEKIVEMVPCAEMVRFGKNGSDATSGAIRLARAYTRRDRIAVCGYHGWHDWYIGSTARHLGVPSIVRELTHSFIYNDIHSLHKIFEQFPDEIAAVILEPMNVFEPTANFLQEVKELAHRYGAVLIFDETVTGFRYANGGAQEYFQVTPDLATFGKGLANGYPISAVTGHSDIMHLMEEIFFSFTFGGETLSLVAALTTMTKLQQEPVIETMRSQGQKVVTGVKNLIERCQVRHILSISGNPTWSFLLIKDVPPYSQWQIKTLFLQEVFARGILTLGSHNISYSHSDDDIEKLLAIYEDVFLILQDAIDNCVLEKYLKCQSLEPLFKVR
jgi:glutamate-1-semialdehyde 2,1-aminomutase